MSITVTPFRLQYSSKNLFFQHSLLYRKDNAHEDSILSCVWGRLKKKDEEICDGEESRCVYSFEFTQTVNSTLLWDIYEKSPGRNYFASEARNHAYCTVKINKLA